MPEQYVICKVSNQKIKNSEAVPITLLRSGLRDFIKKAHPDISNEDFISPSELKNFRKNYIEEFLKTERGDLSKLDKDVVKSMAEHEILVKKLDEPGKKLSFADKMSDKLAEFGGSWVFLTTFFIVLISWVSLNLIFLSKPFDPYPFILLNLFLSCLASIQAPIILMSQNRKESKDRERAENDYKINLKAELEVRHLHEKIDNLMRHQWQRLLEIQQLQLDLLDEKENYSSSKIKRTIKKKLRKNEKKEGH